MAEWHMESANDSMTMGMIAEETEVDLFDILRVF